jgi:ssDNA-binding Zn-finger/Zn-ribbon topoisomerase 1
MKKEILYATAMDSGGNLVQAADAEKEIEYFCPECEGPFVLKKSNRSGKGARRPHFSHIQQNPNCTPEGVLHLSFKKLLLAYLQECISEGHPLEFEWTCEECNSNLSGNLLWRVATAKEELDLKVCRPDIALLDREGDVLAVIEVVVTHAPEDNALNYYREADVVLVQINLSSENDLNEIEARIKKPDRVDYCMKPSCKNYGAPTIERVTQHIPSHCPKCHAQLERYSILVRSLFGERESLEFLETEIGQLKARSSRISEVNVSGSNQKRPVLTCENCLRLSYQFRGRSRRF